MRTWATFNVVYEEQPYKRGLNKLAAFLFDDEYFPFLGDILPDNADHLANIILAIENDICPVSEGWEVGNGKRGDLDGWADQ